MTYRTLLQSQLGQRLLQILLTFSCLSITFLLLGLLLSAKEYFEPGSSPASTHRLRSQGVSSMAQALPVNFADRIANVPGVIRVIYATATPAAYQDDPQHMLLQAVPREGFLETFPELRVAPEGRNFWNSDKLSLIAGEDVADRYSWKVGQPIPLQTNVLNSDGNGTWVFHLAAIYVSDDPKIPSDLTFIRYDYLNDNRVGDKDQALAFISTIDDPAQAGTISARIDGQFETSAPRVVTSPENDAAEKQLAQFGDFGALTIAVATSVFLSMLLLAHNVWHERAIMRQKDFALLKILGFPRKVVVSVVLLEALLVTIAAAGVGTLLAHGLVQAIRPVAQSALPGFYFPATAYAVAAATALTFALVSVIWPCYVALRTPMLAVLRGELR